MRRIAFWVLNLFPDALGVAVLGVVLELLYRLCVHLSMLKDGLQFFPLSAGLFGAVLTVVWRLPALIRAFRSRPRRGPD